jgi:hypothetical protein
MFLLQSTGVGMWHQTNEKVFTEQKNELAIPTEHRCILVFMD